MIERYLLARASRGDLIHVEEHLLTCEACRKCLSEMALSASGASAAGQELQDAPLDATHYTDDGPIHLRCELTEAGAWKATIRGRDIEAARQFASVGEANQYLVESFWQLFPEHTCGARCGPPADEAR